MITAGLTFSCGPALQASELASATGVRGAGTRLNASGTFTPPKAAFPGVSGSSVYRISAAMLPAIRSAASWMETCARWAYLAVVSISLWPSSLPITGRVSPSASALEAKLCRRS